jgi:N-acetyl-S-(2-succino)cysteine monooxygenase
MAKSVAPRRQMKFAVFMHGDSNYHSAGWRHPRAYADGGSNFKRWIEFAQTMERGKLDMLFIADTIGVPGADSMETLSYQSLVDKFEPMTMLAALSSVTEHLGLVATCATTYNEPYNVARVLASIDHLTGGRGGWNLVTGGIREDAFNFNLDTHVEHGDRYERAEEFVDVCHGLWDSFEDDAIIRDKANGVYVIPEKLHYLNHKGKHFSVKGPLSVARSPQGRPVIIQAGASEPAKTLSARIADVVFASQASLGSAKAFYADVKGRLGRFGRSPDDLKIMPGVALFIGRTEAEAEEKYEELMALLQPAVAMSLLRERVGDIDLSGYPLDGPFPELQGNSARMSTPPALVQLARRENLTLRQTAMRMAAARSHWMIKGTPKHVADQFEEWFVNGGADGFNLLPQILPGSLNDFVDLVIPELQRRGLFRTAYEGRTLRENLGVPRPVNRYAAASALRRATS